MTLTSWIARIARARAAGARLLVAAAAAGIVITGCSSETTAPDAGADPTSSATPADDLDDADSPEGDASDGATTFQIEVWADNWSAVHVDGDKVGEDSVPITVERSFNAETYTFEARLPFTVAIEAKDFKETDSGIEYIGEPNQQMGDGGLIAQVTDLTTGEVVTVTDEDWHTLVVQQAPLNTECADDPDPDATCEVATVDVPADWTGADFDDSAWEAATEWSEAEVAPKDGYDEIDWVVEARLVWGSDLEIDNTVLLRTTIS